MLPTTFCSDLSIATVYYGFWTWFNRRGGWWWCCGWRREERNDDASELHAITLLMFSRQIQAVWQLFKYHVPVFCDTETHY